jgi:SNF2 family DNA or RNA helicase
LADKVRDLPDFKLPELKYFNSSPCAQHTEVVVGCRNCGIKPRAHQRQAAAWAYLRTKVLVADQTGTGKSTILALLIAMLKESGQLEDGKVLLVCRAAALRQWTTELNRMLPMIKTVAATGTASKRLKIMRSDWEVMVISRETYVKDHEAFNHIDIVALLCDDVDSLANRGNQISVRLKQLANHCRYVCIANATPLSKRLEQLHSVMELIGGREFLGGVTQFKNTYIQQEKIQMPVRGGRMMTTMKTRGYKNLNQLKSLIRPMVIRRTADQLADVDMPAISTSTVWLDLHPAQRAKYKEIQAGILKIIKEGRIAEIKQLEAITVWMKAAATCTGLPALGEDDGPGASSKLDWIMDKLEGDLSEEKVVIFIHNKSMVLAAKDRMDAAGIKAVVVSGMDSNPTRRAEAIQQFWDDPECKVLIGTSALQSSLNLQVSRHLIMADTLHNPASIQQLAGRVQRVGSQYQTVYVHHLLTRDTIEEGFLEKLEIESALMDHMWDSSSEIFQALSPEQMMRLIIS